MAAFVAAAGAGDLEKVKAALASDPTLALKADVNSRTALHEAKTKAIVEALLAAGARIDADSVARQTPLSSAAFDGRTEAVVALLAAGAIVDAADSKGRTPLARAALGCNKDGVKLLVDAGSDVNAATADGSTPLDLASECSDRAVGSAIVALLREHGAKAGAVAEAPAAAPASAPSVESQAHALGNEALQQGLVVAVMKGLPDQAKDLIAKGADPKALDGNGDSPLSWAVFFDKIEVVRVLLEAGADPNQKNADGSTPFDKASSHPAIDEILKAAGAK